MKNISERILNFLYYLGLFLILGGIVALISLFFSPTFPLWRILIGIIPIIVGTILRGVIYHVSNIVFTTEAIIENIKKKKNKDQHNHNNDQDDY